MFVKRVALATTALTGAVLFAGTASAQSTGTLEAEATVQEVVVTGVRGPRNIEGAIVAVEEPKSRSVLTQEFIAQQTPGNTILDTINILPSVTFTNNDAFGSSGGDITVRGFDSQRVALLFDGIPLNDTGNYEIYPNQQLDPELIESVTVNLGTTDVDSPTAAAAGGTINYVTLRPSEDPSVRFVGSAGSEDYVRGFVLVNTGAFGPFGTTAFLSASYAQNDIFNGPGKIEKNQYNGRLFQDLGGRNDFASIAFNWNRNRNNFIDRITLAEFNAGSKGGNVETTCYRDQPTFGDNNPAVPGVQGDVDSTGSGCFRSALNPSDTGNIRGQFSYGITDTLRLTVDPSFQYTLANGGSTSVYSETAAQLRGNSTAAGVDLNGDGDLLDSVRLFQPNTTNTRRYGVTSSLIWRFAENQSARVAYTFDRGRHRQTGDVGFLQLDGSPEDVFAGKDGYGRRIQLPDGTNLRRRDRVSLALLNQISAEYRGRFLDERLLVNLGVRAPFFKRELNNFCYQQNTFTALCTTQTPTPVPGTDDGTGQTLVRFGTSTTLYGRPREFEREYEELLPNLGLSYDLTDTQSVYVSYAKTLSAPRTDDLYDQVAVDPEFETADAYDLGYRFQSGSLIAAAAIWYNQFSNRIERAFDPDTGIAFSANVGDVTLKGVDGQVGWEPIENLKLYASMSYIDTEIEESRLPGTFGGVPGFFPTAGKELPDVPKWQGSFRVDYEWNNVELGLQYKYTGDRFSNLINSEEAPSYELVDFDARYNLGDLAPALEKTYVQLNVRNVFDEDYLGAIQQADPVPATGTFGTAQYQPGFPRTFIVSVSAEF
jgi:iron complex outermembrane recepter protein